ncbi:CPBP family intramembrane metalloprotease [Acidobacteria bacterium AB60]|nr:CPBP family intramembrane metalloprotease [Acidobacteria bacterium AB60]
MRARGVRWKSGDRSDWPRDTRADAAIADGTMGLRVSSRRNNRASKCVSMGTNRSLDIETGPSALCIEKPARSRRRDLYELVGIYGLILLVIWTPRPWQWPLWGLASISLIAVIAVSYEGMRPMGLCTRNLVRSLWAVGLAMMVALFAVVIAMRMHTLQLASSPRWALEHYGVYAIWAGVQQLILQCFFLSRSLRLLGNATAAAAVSAGLFAIAHLPNPFLTLVTLFCGLASCLFFLHYKNLWPLAMAHAILGIVIAITIPGPLDHNMMVGIGYVTWAERDVLPPVANVPRALTAKP